LIITSVFEKNYKFFAENWRKITETCDHNIDPSSAEEKLAKKGEEKSAKKSEEKLPKKGGEVKLFCNLPGEQPSEFCEWYLNGEKIVFSSLR
jgi:hypothetical protein